MKKLLTISLIIGLFLAGSNAYAQLVDDAFNTADNVAIDENSFLPKRIVRVEGMTTLDGDPIEYPADDPIRYTGISDEVQEDMD